MAQIVNQGLSLTQINTLISNALSGLPVSFVNNGSPMTLQQLFTNFPASATYAGLYARISNLFNNVSLSAAGGTDDIVRCRFDITNGIYAWQPQRLEYNTVNSTTSGTITLTPLVTPPTVRLTGTLLGNLSINPSATNAYIGQRFKVIQNSTLGVFVTTITGLIGSNITLLGNTVQDLEYTLAGWAKSST